jgi:hypothetical protein
MTVKDLFAAATGTQAWTPYGGGTIYIDAGRLGGKCNAQSGSDHA